VHKKTDSILFLRPVPLNERIFNINFKQMSTKKLSLVSKICVFLFVLSIMASCNRGVGCPNQFKAVAKIGVSILK
jgi:hypothetical protein